MPAQSIPPLTDVQSKFVADHIAIAYWGVRRFRRRFPTLDPDSILSACQLGLMMAARKYDGRGHFASYASLWMFCTCQAEQIKCMSISVPSYCIRGSNEMSGKPNDRVRQAKSIVNLTRLDNNCPYAADPGIHGLVDNQEGADYHIEISEEVGQLLPVLDRWEHLVIEATVMGDQSNRAAGEVLGTRGELIRRTKNQAIAKLRNEAARRSAS